MPLNKETKTQTKSNQILLQKQVTQNKGNIQ